MSDPTLVQAHADPSGHATRLPPGPSIPKLVQGFWFALARRQMIDRLTRRYGDAYTIKLPTVGTVVVVTDPDLAKQTFQVSPEELGILRPNLSDRLLGPGSVFALDGADHRRRRDQLSPPFHGRSVRRFEQVFVEETLRETADWPIERRFETLEPMLRIALNAMLRGIFGAEGSELGELRQIIPPWVTLGQRLTTLPMPRRTFGRFTPWGRLAELRRRYEVVLDELIARALADPNFADRNDVLSILLRSTDEDGHPMSRGDIGDELLTFLAAGHETTAATLAWVFERISREPELLAALTAEADSSENSLRRATIREVQRTRTVVDFTGRHVYAPTIRLGDWVIPRGSSVMVFISQIHVNPAAFDHPAEFEPQRFVGASPQASTWIPYGGGTRRCPGASFANIGMDVVLRTVLRQFVIVPTVASAEKRHARGVAFTPKDGGRIVIRHR
ncbi:cytochrome P450 [Mycolicibacterium baixiangningiae]|uniref:cytochrome P450 n=1 Tax=Mycolicibacterium baixiangningiae TaxID=2761578 RepID=UPI001867503F|nr:cytochrome P450 [Mycolicibacterium baixiangningiae]